MAKSKRTPWEKSNPKKKRGKASKKFSSSDKAAAKRSAKKAGRSYPNLVDNMRVASKKKKTKRAKKRK